MFVISSLLRDRVKGQVAAGVLLEALARLVELLRLRAQPEDRDRGEVLEPLGRRDAGQDARLGFLGALRGFRLLSGAERTVPLLGFGLLSEEASSSVAGGAASADVVDEDVIEAASQ